MKRATSYTGDDGIERCLDCDGFLSEPGAKCVRCANRIKAAKDADKAATKAATEQEKRDEKKDAEREQVARWRSNTLRRYIVRLLATKSGSLERSRYFAENPVSEIFK